MAASKSGSGEARGLRLLAQHDLNGFGNGGEGTALQATSDGRRILYIAHVSPPIDFTAVDVTDPRNPIVVTQTRLPHDRVRSNSLALVGDLLLVAYQTTDPGLKPAGIGLYDVSDPATPKPVSFFDTSGPLSRGAHSVWCVDGQYAHISSSAPDFESTHPLDYHLYMIVDVSNPSQPFEAGRWWLPGTRVGDAESPPVRHTGLDSGFRPHNANVYPQRPDRAYLGYIDGGVIILDISDMARPKLVSRLDYHPPFSGFTHTVVPLFERDLLVVTDEAIREDCSDHPKLVWLIDVREEANPVIVSTLPLPSAEEHCGKPGRFGAHNIHENPPVPTAWHSDSLIVGAYFNAGLRVHSIDDPFRPEEVASFVPSAPDEATGVNINDVYVDEKGLIYAIERGWGGLYILEMDL